VTDSDDFLKVVNVENTDKDYCFIKAHFFISELFHSVNKYNI